MLVRKLKGKPALWAIPLLIALFMFAACTPRLAVEPEANFTFNIVDQGQGIEITGYTGNSIEVRIPNRIQGLPVTAIGRDAFRGAQITRVVIPNGVTRIENNAFRDATLTAATVPNSVTHIGWGAFAGTHIPNPPVPTAVFPMVRIEGGTFTMGAPVSETNQWLGAGAAGWASEQPQRQVTVSGFFMGAHTVTQGLWEDVMGTNPSHFRGENLPVENVSWFDAVRFANELSLGLNLTPAYTIDGNTVTWNREANGFRLPTEAEWEFAARAGTTTPWNTGTSISREQANFDSNRTMEVGSFAPNAWGLYDMHGNVWEWVWDWFGPYPSAAQTDPVGAPSGSNRVLRGGSWGNSAEFTRSAVRYGFNPSFRGSFLGFRLVRP